MHRILEAFLSFPGDTTVLRNSTLSVRLPLLLCALPEGLFRALLVGGMLLGMSGPLLAQDTGANDRIKNGFILTVPVPLTTSDATAIVDQLKTLNQRAPDDQRITVILQYSIGKSVRGKVSEEERRSQGSGGETAFEDAFRLARAITGDQLRKIRVVSWVNGEVLGHSVLPIIASDLLLVGPSAVIGDASVGETSSDETLPLNYLAIAKRRGLFPPAVVSAMVDSSLELASVTKVGGAKAFAVGDELKRLRSEGKLLGEEVWSRSGESLRMTAKQLRSVRVAAGVADSIDEVSERLDLAMIEPVTGSSFEGEVKGALLEITGSIAASRCRRWQSNLASTLSRDQVNAWVISIDSIGGSLDSSATLAGRFIDRQPPLRTVAGFVRGEARGDSALVAFSCKPLLMKTGTRIGGQGAETMSAEDMAAYDELITEIADQTNRPAALIRGILNPSLEVFRYQNRKTGRIRYATKDDLAAEVEAATESGADREAEMSKWQRGERIELAEGVSATDAISLGLAEGQADSLEAAVRKMGFQEIPPPIADRGLVRFVERLGRSNGLVILLLFIGFAALSAEMNAPGLGFPGFIAMICFALFFWIKYLAGTAEWLELLALTLGLVCIAIEIFVVPGVGVFGIGGLALTVLGIVLMSQTFVIPQNVYQINLFTRGIWAALGGAVGMIGGFLVIRTLFPHLPFFRGLVMESPDSEQLGESEKLGDYGYLLGRTGITTTPLRPAGKVRFGEEIVQVMSDGSSISSGQNVRVCEVHTTKVIVESIS